MKFNIKDWQDKNLKEDKELIKYKAGQKYSKMIGGKLHQVEITKILPNGKFNGISKTLGSEPVRSKGNKIKNGTLTAWLDGYIKESQDKYLTKNPVNEGKVAVISFTDDGGKYPGADGPNSKYFSNLKKAEKWLELEKFTKSKYQDNFDKEDGFVASYEDPSEGYGINADLHLVLVESVNEGKHYEDETRFKTKNGQIAHIDDRMGDKYYITYYDKNGNEKDDGEIWLKDIEKNIKIGKWIAESVNEDKEYTLTNKIILDLQEIEQGYKTPSVKKIVEKLLGLIFELQEELK